MGSKTGCEVWDIEGGRPIKTIAAHASTRTLCFDFSPGGNEIAIGTDDGAVLVASLTTKNTRILKPVSSRIQYIRYNPGGDLLATSSYVESAAIVRNALTGDIRCHLSHPQLVWRFAWSQDGRLLATGCNDANARVWDIPKGTLLHTLSGHMLAVALVDFGAKDVTLLSNGWDGTARLWDTRRGIPLLTLPSTEGLALDAESNILRFAKRVPELILGTAALTHDDAFQMIVADSIDTNAKSSEIYIAKNGRWALTGSHAGMRIWDLEHRCQIGFIPMNSTESIAVHPQELELVTRGVDGVLRWPLDVGHNAIRVGPPETVAPTHRIHQCAYTADGESVVAASHKDGQALVFPMDNRGEPRRIGPHGGMSGLALSPNNNWLATGTFKGTGVRVWDFRTGNLIKDLPVEGSAITAFSPGGKWLAASSGAEIEIWHAGTWKRHGRLPRSRPRFRGGPLAFSPDGRLLAFADSAPPLKLTLVDPNTLEQLATLECSEDIVIPVSMSFTPDGTRLVFPHPRQGNILCIWDLRAVREQLKTMNLDWDLPPYPSAELDVKSPRPLRVEIDLGELTPGS